MHGVIRVALRVPNLIFGAVRLKCAFWLERVHRRQQFANHPQLRQDLLRNKIAQCTASFPFRANTGRVLLVVYVRTGDIAANAC